MLINIYLFDTRKLDMHIKFFESYLCQTKKIMQIYVEKLKAI